MSKPRRLRAMDGRWVLVPWGSTADLLCAHRARMAQLQADIDRIRAARARFELPP